MRMLGFFHLVLVFCGVLARFYFCIYMHHLCLYIEDFREFSRFNIRLKIGNPCLSINWSYE